MPDIQKGKIPKIEEVSRDGSIAVVEGKVQIQDPQPEGRAAMIHPHPSILIRINGTPITQPSQVTAQDQVELIPETIAGKRVFHIRTDQEKIHAYGTIEYQPSKNVILLDSAHSRELIPQVKILEKAPEAYTFEEILQELEEAQITYGIHKDGIHQLLERPKQEFLLARGKEIQKGTDGYIEYLFYSQRQETDLQDINTKVNFKELKAVPSVKKGDVIARRTPPIPGKDGIDIYGNPMKAPRVQDPTLTPGNNVELDHEELQAISLVNGKPTQRGNILHVFSLHEVSGDVDIKSGNIDFSGDVVVNGNVKEGMQVKAGHNIEIYGSIAGAHLEACGEIQIKNWAFQSTVIAGASEALLREMVEQISLLHSLMIQLLKGTMEVSRQLSAASVVPPFGKIVAIVMEKHFQEISNRLKKLSTTDPKKTSPFLDQYYHECIQDLAKKYSPYGALKIKTQKEVREDILIVGNMKKELESQCKYPMDLSVAYAQNTHLKASGDLIITGQGCLNSTVVVGGGVRMQEEKPLLAPCVFRGGEIRCTTDIQISEIGSSGGAYTKIHTGKQGKILFNTLYYNTHIQIGEATKKIERNYKKGICFRNPKGEIIIRSN